MKIKSKICYLSFLLLFFLTFSNTIFAQSTKDSIQSKYLPEIGDWAIGIDATPIFQYAGNLFSQNGNPYTPSIRFNAEYPGSIFMKVKLGYATTVRGILLVGISHSEDDIINLEDDSNPHKLINSGVNIGLIAGVERKKSIRNRLISYYGIQAGAQKIPYNTGSSFGLIEYIDQNDEEVYFKEYGGNTFRLITDVFIGLEYFILPKFAISGEIDLNFNREVQYRRYRKRGTSEREVIDDRILSYNINPGTSGNIGIFIYF